MASSNRLCENAAAFDNGNHVASRWRSQTDNVVWCRNGESDFVGDRCPFGRRKTLREQAARIIRVSLTCIHVDCYLEP